MNGVAQEPPRPDLDAPILTLPEAEAELLRATYASAKVILEYGSGGSTILAASGQDKTIFSVESDAAWAQKMRLFFKRNPSKSAVNIHDVDIGPTGEWGRPIDETGWKSYHQYPLSVWHRPDFVNPDVVLIDGRFRSACFVTAALSLTAPATVLWDDYVKRRSYHEVERWLKPVSMHGRMARFDLEPRMFSPKDMMWMMKQFTRML